MDLIKAQNIALGHNAELTEYSERVIKAINKKDGYCPCVPDMNPDTLCPCKTFREESKCHCNLFKQELETIKL